MCLRIALIWSNRSSVSIFTNWGSGGLMPIKLSTFKFLRCNSHIKIYEKCYGKTSLGSKYLNQIYPADFPTVTVGHSQSSCWGVFWTMEIEDVNNTPSILILLWGVSAIWKSLLFAFSECDWQSLDERRGAGSSAARTPQAPPLPALKYMQTVSVLTNQRASEGVASLITPSSGARPSSLFNYAGKLFFFYVCFCCYYCFWFESKFKFSVYAVHFPIMQMKPISYSLIELLL